MILETGGLILNSWQTFYTIIGTAAATLMGLMFVVTSLVAGIDRRLETLNAGMSAFNTPTIVHFAAVLLVAAILSAPWPSYTGVRILLGLLGLSGAAYLVIVQQRVRHIPGYQASTKDWLWYIAFPLFTYVALVGVAIALAADPILVLYFIATLLVLLLLIAIRNGWDLVTYLALERSHPGDSSHA